MTAASSGGDGYPLITQFAGSYDISHQYKGGAPAWSLLTIGSDGSLTFNDASGPSITADDISTVYDRMSCCGRVDIALNFDLNGDGSVTGTDRINLYAASGGGLAAVEYPTGSSSQNDVGVRVNSLPTLSHDGTAVPASNSIAATAVVSGGSSTALDIPMDADVSGSPTFNSFTLTASAKDGNNVLQQKINLRVEAGATLTQGQTLDCYEYRDGSKTLRIDLQTRSASTDSYSTQYGGRCQITLTRVEASGYDFTAIEGTFTAELYPFKRDNAPVTVQNGVFRWVP